MIADATAPFLEPGGTQRGGSTCILTLAEGDRKRVVDNAYNGE
jgi:hypothetical protein